MKKAIIILLAVFVLLVTGCKQEVSAVDKEKKASENSGMIAEDKRVVQATLVDDEIWGLLRDYKDPQSSNIICYQLTDQSKELNTDTPYDVISDESLQLGLGTKIAVNDDLISFQDNSLFLAYFLKSKEVDFQNLDQVASRAYTTTGGAYVGAEDQWIRVRNSMNHKLLWEAKDSSMPLQFFTWYHDTVQFAYLAGQNEVKFTRVVEETIHSIPLSDFAPEGLVDYTNLFWSADGTHLIVEALCEHGAVLQVIRISTGQVVYEYDFEDDGTLLGVIGGNQLLILDDAKERRLIVCNYWTGNEQTLVETELYIHFAMLNRYENKLIYDLYDPDKKEQVVQIMDLSEINMQENSSNIYEKAKGQEMDLAEKLNVPLSVIDRLIDKGYIVEEIAIMTMDSVKEHLSDSPILLEEIEKYQFE
jgi:hypothetical protein